MAGFNALYDGSVPNVGLALQPVQNALLDFRDRSDKAALMDQKRQIGSQIQAGNWDEASRTAAGYGDIDTAMGIRKFQTSERQADAQAKIADVNYQQHLARLNGGAAQMILAEKDPAKQQQMWGAIRSQHPQFDDTLQKHGINPNDHLAGAQFLMAQARGYRDPLDEQVKRAQLAHSQVSTAAAQAQLQQPRSQTPEYRASVAANYGLTKGTPEYNSFVLNGTYAPKDTLIRAKDGEKIGVPQYGPDGKVISVQQVLDNEKTPAGYRSVPGGLEAIPGGPADIKQNEKRQQDFAAMQSVSSSMDRLAAEANRVLTHPGLSSNYGLWGALPNVPGTQAADAAALIHTLKTQSAFSTLQDMRNSSKTGGALGAVSDKEGAMLQEAIAALDKSQSIQQVQENLKRIIAFTQSSKQRLTDVYNDHWNRGGAASKAPASAAPPAPTKPPHQMSNDELLQSLGISK